MMRLVVFSFGFSSIKLIAVTAAGARFGPPGYECDLLYLACLAALVLGGSGHSQLVGFSENGERLNRYGSAPRILD